ncbi:MAG: hypothetical protein AB7V44_32600, partial [Pseudonocardia sp.]
MPATLQARPDFRSSRREGAEAARRTVLPVRPRTRHPENRLRAAVTWNDVLFPRLIRAGFLRYSSYRQA